MIDTKRKQTQAKANWKRRTKSLLNTVGKVFEDIQYGRRPGFADFMTYSERMFVMGQRGIKLHQTLVEADFNERSIRDISKVLKLVEVASRHLTELGRKLGFPMESLPQFVDPTSFAKPSETSYDSLMETKEGQRV